MIINHIIASMNDSAILVEKNSNVPVVGSCFRVASENKNYAWFLTAKHCLTPYNSNYKSASIMAMFDDNHLANYVELKNKTLLMDISISKKGYRIS